MIDRREDGRQGALEAPRDGHEVGVRVGVGAHALDALQGKAALEVSQAGLSALVHAGEQLENAVKLLGGRLVALVVGRLVLEACEV